MSAFPHSTGGDTNQASGGVYTRLSGGLTAECVSNQLEQFAEYVVLIFIMIETHYRNHIWEGTQCKMPLPNRRDNERFGRKQTALCQRQEDKNKTNEGLIGEAIHGVGHPGYDSHS